VERFSGVSPFPWERATVGAARSVRLVHDNRCRPLKISVTRASGPSALPFRLYGLGSVDRSGISPEKPCRFLVSGTGKLQRRIRELEQLDVQSAILQETGDDEVVKSNVRATILDVFGPHSPEFKEHQYLEIWAGGTLAPFSVLEAEASNHSGPSHSPSPRPDIIRA
jgi:hypothetical protein